jgi:hypothetical protein
VRCGERSCDGIRLASSVPGVTSSGWNTEELTLVRIFFGMGLRLFELGVRKRDGAWAARARTRLPFALVSSSSRVLTAHHGTERTTEVVLERRVGDDVVQRRNARASVRVDSNARARLLLID